MADIAQLIFLLVLYLPVTVLVNRLQLLVLPQKRDLPAQGTILRSALITLVLFMALGAWTTGDAIGEKLLWLSYLGLTLGCGLLVYVSIMCVSESGRRFYLMDLVQQTPGISLEELKNRYGRDHMLSIRLQRLCTWKVLNSNGSVYRLSKISAYLYSRAFQLWGQLLGFTWR